MKRVLVPLADGCEDLEAITITDLLVRAGAEVVRAGLKPGEVVAGRGTRMVPDTTLEGVKNDTFDMIALPGGMPGADHLAESPVLRDMVLNQFENGRWVAAICAAPRALAAAGVLENRTVTCFPGALDGVAPASATVTGNPMEVDGHIITAKGPGVAMDFALTLVEKLWDKKHRKDVEGPLQRPGIDGR